MKQPWVKKWGDGEPLDSGGQGETYFVPNRAKPKGVLKVLKGAKKVDLKARRRMYQEVANLITLNTAGAKVPAILDHNITTQKIIEDLKTELFFVMEFVSGKTLATVVESANSLTLEQSIGVCLALCSTLRIVVGEKIVHRDLKQENIIVRDLASYDIVMVDFGISFHKEAGPALTEYEEVFQNSLIRLPERTGIGEDKRDPRSDLTDVCAILFFCLTGQPPRNPRDSHNNAPHEAVAPQLTTKTRSAGQLNFLNAFFDKGFQPDIDLRFQTIDELENRLKEVMETQNNEATESLSSIVARSRDRLRKKDIKTQINSFRNQIRNHVSGHPPFDSTDGFAYQLRSMINDCEPFHVYPPDSSELWNQNQGYDRIFTFKIAVKHQIHNIELSVRYDFEFENGECVISRYMQGDKLTAQANNIPLPKSDEEFLALNSPIVFGPIKIVTRYSDPSLFPNDVLLRDAEAAIGNCIQMIENQILQA